MEKLTEAMVKAIDTESPKMQNLKIGQKYNELVDAYNDLEAKYNALKNPKKVEIPADNDGILNDTATDGEVKKTTKKSK